MFSFVHLGWQRRHSLSGTGRDWSDFDFQIRDTMEESRLSSTEAAGAIGADVEYDVPDLSDIGVLAAHACLK